MAVDFYGATAGNGKVLFDNSVGGRISGNVITVSLWLYADGPVAWSSTAFSCGKTGEADHVCYVPADAGSIEFSFRQVGDSRWHWWDLELDAANEFKWVHLLCTYDWTSPSTPAILYADGVDQGAPTYGGTASGGRISGVDTISFGSATAAYCGRLAEFASWNAIYGASEARALAAGMCPLQIDLGSQAFYVPMYKTTGIVEQFTGAVASPTGTLFETPHPPVQQAIIPIRHAPRISPHALPARINMRDDTSFVPSRDYWGPHVYRRGNRT